MKSEAQEKGASGRSACLGKRILSNDSYFWPEKCTKNTVLRAMVKRSRKSRVTRQESVGVLGKK